MAIPLQALKAAVEAGHPDHALIGMPVSLVRELLNLLPVATIVVPPADTAWLTLECGARTPFNVAAA